jgi:hypothetical protein
MPFRGSTVALDQVIEAEFTSPQLRELARWLGVTPRGNSRVGLIEQVVTALRERVARLADTPEALLEGLSDEQQEFARRLLTARDHELPIPRTVMAMVWRRPMDREADRKLGELIDALRTRALLFPTHATYPSGYRDVFYQWLPLPGNVPVMQFDADIASEASTASHVALRPFNFLEDFDVFLSAIMQSGATLRPTLPAHKQAPRLSWLREWEHDADEVERILRSRPNWVPDPQTGITIPLMSAFTPQAATALENQTGLSAAQCEFFLAIACAMQLLEYPELREQVSSVYARPRASAIEEWLVLNGEQKLRRAWKAWSEEIMAPLEARSASASMRARDTFILMRAIGARDLTPALFAAEWCALRRTVARVLHGLPAGEWIDWADLQLRLFAFYPECAWTFATRVEWWFAMHGGSRIQTGREEEWRNSIGKIIERILMESLAWFGAVEVKTQDGALTAFRVTDLGQALISAATALPATSVPSERAIEPIDWVDKFTLRVPPAPDRAAFIGAIRQAADRGDAPFTYVFTPASIERALQNGVSMDDIGAQFKLTKVNLPRHISEQFKQIARRFGRIRVYQSLTVLELADDFAARELAASTSLTKRVIYQLSPRAFVLPDDAIDALIEEMQAKGYTPRVK